MANRVDDNRDSAPDAKATNPDNPEMQGHEFESWHCIKETGAPDSLTAEGAVRTQAPPVQEPFKFYTYELN